MSSKAILIGNSDGIGLAATRSLLDQSWQVIGLSRSTSQIEDSAYEHVVVDVQSESYLDELTAALERHRPLDLCLFCVGVGELLDVTDMDGEPTVIDVNFLSMVKTASRVIPVMVEAGGGHFIGLSSLADEMLSPEAPSYHASKAGFSNYIEGLGLALKSKGVCVSNVRFGFVDTKMAKGDVRPFMMSTDRAVHHLMKCIKKRPIRYTAPWIVIPLVRFRACLLRLNVLFSRSVKVTRK